MPINYFVKEKKKQKYLSILSGIIILATFFILWFGYFKKGNSSSQPLQKTANSYYKEIKIDFSVFENSFLKELQPFEKIAPFEDEKGRDNPFLPY